MKFVLFLLMIISQFGCKYGYLELYSESSINEWHKIDLKSFELETPEVYKFKPHQGIDSFVGEISNGKTVFSFDFGWYSNRGTLTPIEFFEKHPFRFYFSELLDSLGLSNANDSLKSQIKKNLTIKSVDQIQRGRYLARVELKNEPITFTFSPFDPDFEQAFGNYEFEIEENQEFYKKLYYPKSSKK